MSKLKANLNKIIVNLDFANNPETARQLKAALEQRIREKQAQEREQEVKG